MTAALLPLAIGGTILSGVGQMQAGQAAAAQGAAQQVASNYSAEVLGQQAGQTRAAAQAASGYADINTAYALSKARATAAASGGGGADPTVTNIEGQIAARGNYNALSSLYSGEEKARGLENQAALDVYTGEQQKIAGDARASGGMLAGIGTILSGGASLFSKYGGSG